MEIITKRNYLKKYFFIFLLLLVCVFVISLIGNYLLYNIKHSGDTQNLFGKIFNLIDFLLLISSFLRDMVISALLVFTLFKLINKKISFIEILYLVVGANFLFVLQNIFDLTWVYLHKKELSFSQILDFQSFSLNNLFNHIPNYLYHAAVTLNLWELAYIFLLAFLLKKRLNRTYIKSFGLLFLAYGVPLILYIIFETFIRISNA